MTTDGDDLISWYSRPRVACKADRSQNRPYTPGSRRTQHKLASPARRFWKSSASNAWSGFRFSRVSWWPRWEINPGPRVRAAWRRPARPGVRISDRRPSARRGSTPASAC